MNNVISISNLPFFWRIKKHVQDKVPEIPERFLFEFSIIPEIQLIIEKRNHDLDRHLSDVYKLDANIGFLQDGHALADSYGTEFVSFIDESLEVNNVSLKLATEIGCGGGYVLQKLLNKGIKVKGIDPSPLAARQGEKLGFPVLKEFYPTPKLHEKSDLIFHYDVLEHVSDPMNFLAHNFEDLNVNGILAFGLPDCTESIEHGDISMAMHEHMNYFDDNSLRLALTRAGFQEITIKKSNHGGLLFACARKTSEIKAAYTDNTSISKLHSFEEKFNRYALKMKRFIDDMNSRNKDAVLGFYVPLRAFPYISYFKLKHDFRLFDDSASLYQGFYDGIDIPIENFEDLVKSPPTHVIIMTFRFADVIERKIRNKLGDKIMVASLRSFV